MNQSDLNKKSLILSQIAVPFSKTSTQTAYSPNAMYTLRNSTLFSRIPIKLYRSEYLLARCSFVRATSNSALSTSDSYATVNLSNRNSNVNSFVSVILKYHPQLNQLNLIGPSVESRVMDSDNLWSKEAKTIPSKFVTKLMRTGHKEQAEQLLLKALKKVEQELKKKVNQVSLESKSNVAMSASLNSPSALAKGEKVGLTASGREVRVSVKPDSLVNTVKASTKSTALASPTDDGKGSVPVGSSLELTGSLSLVKLLDQIIFNAKPLIRLKKVRIAGATHQKPIALTQKQAETDAIKRIITNANARSEKSAVLKLAKEFEEIYLNLVSNKTLTEVRDLHKLAELNKANVTLKS